METDNRLQVIERLKQSANVLVTVNNNPSVDQLAACIGVTLLLNKLGKHATAVFSGAVPSTIEFLKPEETIEKNTDSLRDFIIALDKSKADKLRYKVEDTMVKIFITPYKTSISDKDLEFSQGDFNVDVVLAIGIQEKEQVDQAIMAHGRILHDAVVMSVNTQQGGAIGSINWVEEKASSLCEMLTSIADDLQQQSLDEQISTALLTGIVAETERFRNDKTTSVTMSMSSKLMAAGANQQLVATELEPEPEPEPEPELIIEKVQVDKDDKAEESDPEEDEGAIIIDHPEDKPPEVPSEPELPPIDPNEIDIDKEGTLRKAAELAEEGKQPEPSEKPAQEEQPNSDSKLVIEPPTMGGTLTANSQPEQLDPSVDPLSSGTANKPILSHSSEPEAKQTLGKIEESTSQPESAQPDSNQAAYPTSYFDTNVTNEPVADVGDARDAVQEAIGQAEADGTAPPERSESLGATAVPMDAVNQPSPSPLSSPAEQGLGVNPSTGEPQFPPNLVPASPDTSIDATASSVETSDSPPPVPPPMMPPIDSNSTASPQ